MATARRVIQIDVTTTPQARKAVQELNTRLRTIEGNSEKAAKSLRRMGSNINLMALAAKAYVAIRFARTITDTVDSMVLLEARIKLVADETLNLNDVMDDLFETADRTRSSIDATGQLYQRLALATKETNISHEDLLKTTGALSNALLLSGNNAQEAASIMIQLSQALAKGKLDGDEFRSVSENAAVVMDLLAEKLEVTRGELFELSKAGELTREVVIDALIEGSDDLQRKVEELPSTFGQAFTRIGNQAKRLARVFQDEFSTIAGTLGDFVAGRLKVLADELERIRAEPPDAFPGLKESSEEAERLRKSLADFRAAYEAAVAPGSRVSENTQRLLLERTLEIEAQLHALGRVATATKDAKDELDRALGVIPEFSRERIGPPLAEPFSLPEEDEGKNETRRKIQREQLTWQEQYLEGLIRQQTEIDRFTEKVKLLDDAFFDGKISVEVYQEELERLTGKLVESEVVIEDWSEAMKTAIAGSVVDSIGSMTDAFVDFALTGKQSFAELTSSILADISKMILRMVVLNSLKSAFGGTSFGNFLFPTGTPSFATGTPYVPQDGLAYLHKGERVVPASQNTVTNNNNYTTERPISIVNVQDPNQIGEIMGGSIGEEVVINHIRRNPDLIRQVLS